MGPASRDGTRLFESAAWKVATRTVLFIFTLLFLIWLLVRLREVVIQLLLAVIVAAGMTPLVDRIAQPRDLGIGGRTWTPPRALVVLMLYLLLLATIGVIGALVAPPVVDDIEDLISRLPDYAASFQAWLDTAPQQYPFLAGFNLDFDQELGDQLRALSAQLAAILGQTANLVRVLFGVLGGALNGILVLVLALYITQDSDRIQRYLVGFLPPDRQEQAMRVSARIGDRLGGWLRGQILLSAIIGTITLVGLSVIGVRYAVVLALIAAIGEAIPLVGPIISAVPAIAVALFQSPLQGLLTLVLYILVQQLENHLVVPKVMERAVALHPLAVIIALLAGSQLLGVTGAILSVPVTAALSVVLSEVRLELDERDGRLRGTPAAMRPAPVTPPAVTPSAAPAGAVRGAPEDHDGASTA
jgi:predicted PurR-regulated permease PerM